MNTNLGFKSLLCASLFAGAAATAAENTQPENWEIVSTKWSEGNNILTLRLQNTIVPQIQAAEVVQAPIEVVQAPVDVQPIIDSAPQIMMEELAPQMTSEQLWQNHFTANYFSIYQTAFAVVKASKRPKLDAWRGAMWPVAIGNFEGIMESHVRNNLEVPKIKNWPVRGTAKKYNKELLKRLNKNIVSQKEAFIKPL